MTKTGWKVPAGHQRAVCGSHGRITEKYIELSAVVENDCVELRPQVRSESVEKLRYGLSSWRVSYGRVSFIYLGSLDLK